MPTKHYLMQYTPIPVICKGGFIPLWITMWICG